MPEEKHCFIIMPLTTPDNMLIQYGNDEDHFYHVLDYIFVPSVEKAGYKPIRPIAEGADNIPAEIIKNLVTAELVPKQAYSGWLRIKISVNPAWAERRCGDLLVA